MKTSHYPDLINLSLLVLGGLVLLPLCNGDTLFMAQERNLFLSGAQFLNDCLRNVGGGTEWLGRRLTQLFYYPWLGGSVLVSLWVLIYLLLRRAFPLSPQWRWLCAVPLVALLVSVIDLGYWIYYIKLPGYWFRESLGLCCCTLLLWGSKKQSYLSAVLSLCLYPLIGWYSVLALLAIAVGEMLAKRWLPACVAILLLLVGPPAIARVYTTLPVGYAWLAAFPLIESNQTFSWVRTLPFIIMAASLMAVYLMGNCKKQCSRLLQGGAYVCLVAWLCLSNYVDHNYHAEMRAYRAIEEFRLGDVLKEVKDAPNGPTRQMVVSKNIALLYTDHLHDQLFQYPTFGVDPVVSDSLPVHMVQTAAPLFYLYHGMTNDATHWCIENSVEYGLTVSDLRILSLAALVNGESKVAAKYLQMLNGTAFYGDFAKHYLLLAFHPEWFDRYPELQIMKELNDDLEEYINSDKGNCEKQIYEAFANQAHHSNARGRELAMAYALMLKDYELIWHHLPAYARHLGKNKMPRQYQEAVYLGTQMKGAPYSADEFNFDADIPQRFNFFFSQNNLRDDHSYWWFFQYCNNVRFY